MTNLEANYLSYSEAIKEGVNPGYKVDQIVEVQEVVEGPHTESPDLLEVIEDPEDENPDSAQQE